MLLAMKACCRYLLSEWTVRNQIFRQSAAWIGVPLLFVTLAVTSYFFVNEAYFAG